MGNVKTELMRLFDSIRQSSTEAGHIMPDLDLNDVEGFVWEIEQQLRQIQYIVFKTKNHDEYLHMYCDKCKLETTHNVLGYYFHSPESNYLLVCEQCIGLPKVEILEAKDDG